MGREDVITKAIKLHDRELYCERSGEGKLCVYRKGQRVESFRLDDDGTGADESVLHFLRPTPHFVFALTENWRMASEPRDWGLEPILARIKAHDLWNRDVAGDAIEQELKESASLERERQNTIESFLLDYRRQFAKAFDGVNTSTLAKKDSRRTYDKRVT